MDGAMEISLAGYTANCLNYLTGEMQTYCLSLWSDLLAVVYQIYSIMQAQHILIIEHTIC